MCAWDGGERERGRRGREGGGGRGRGRGGRRVERKIKSCQGLLHDCTKLLVSNHSGNDGLLALCVLYQAFFGPRVLRKFRREEN